MRHPSQAALALHAGGDLGKFARWKVGRHLAKCDDCCAELAAFEGMRQMVAEASDIPEISWNRLAEMKANIRLGLAAGECVRPGEIPLRDTRWFGGVRAAVACAGIACLMVTGFVLERPGPVVVVSQIPMVEATGDGIRMSAGGTAVGLMNRGVSVQNVSYLPNAQGGISASYVDPSTGRMTVNTVLGGAYGQ